MLQAWYVLLFLVSHYVKLTASHKCLQGFTGVWLNSYMTILHSSQSCHLISQSDDSIVVWSGNFQLFLSTCLLAVGGNQSTHTDTGASQ